jgi:hypothetical protein
MAAAATLLVGCAEGTYVYRPAQQATAVVGSLPAARYAVPAERPTGEVLVASSGLTQMPEASGRTPALFVRMIVTNNSDDAPYVIDTAQQFAFIGGEKQSPAFVNTYKQAQPALEVPRGEKRLLDLYYRLPAKLDADDKVPQFDFAWSVQTSSRIVAERTSFDRTRVEPVYARGYYPYYGPGPYWWYDPWWPYPYYGVGIGVGVGYYRHYGHGYYGHGYYGGGYRGYGGGRGGYIRATPTRR